MRESKFDIMGRVVGAIASSACIYGSDVGGTFGEVFA